MKWSVETSATILILCLFCNVISKHDGSTSSSKDDRSKEAKEDHGFVPDRMPDAELIYGKHVNTIKDNAVPGNELEDHEPKNNQSEDDAPDNYFTGEVNSLGYDPNLDYKPFQPPFRSQFNRDDWSDYNKKYYYGREADEPTIFRRKRNMADGNEHGRLLSVLRRRPMKRVPRLHTPFEQLMKSRRGIKRSTRAKRDIPSYYQERLSELLALMAIQEAKEEAEKEQQYVNSLPWKYEADLRPEEEEENGEVESPGLNPYQLPYNIFNELVQQRNQRDNHVKKQDGGFAPGGDQTDEDDAPTFFRRPYYRRSDSSFYPPPNAYQWLLSGQKRGKWGQLAEKRRYYDDGDDGEDDEIDPAKLYLFASLLDDEDNSVPVDSQLPLRKRLIR